MSIWIVISSVVTAFATGLLAAYAYKSHQLTKAIKESTEHRDKEEKAFKQKIKDFYQAVVVSNILSAPDAAKFLDKQKVQIEAF